MALLKDRRVILAGGAGVALAAGLLAAGIIASRNQEPSVAPPASQGGLTVQTGRDDDIRLDPSRPLRCFVGGQLVGELPLSACAKRNGVATGALDVGLDPSGALAASHGVSSDITPLPPPPEPAVSVAEAPDPSLATALADEPVDETPRAPRAMAATCWRYASAGWRKLAGDMPMGACVQLLYAGRCERAGAADYGRWGDRTLRMVPGRVEISNDNRSFHTLYEQGPECGDPSQG